MGHVIDELLALARVKLGEEKYNNISKPLTQELHSLSAEELERWEHNELLPLVVRGRIASFEDHESMWNEFKALNKFDQDLQFEGMYQLPILQHFLQYLQADSQDLAKANEKLEKLTKTIIELNDGIFRYKNSRKNGNREILKQEDKK